MTHCKFKGIYKFQKLLNFEWDAHACNDRVRQGENSISFNGDFLRVEVVVQNLKLLWGYLRKIFFSRQPLT